MAVDDAPQPPALGRLDDPTPHARLLGNGRQRVLLSGAGSGVSSLGGVALTSWAADRTEDADGFFIYLRDLDDGRLWSAGHQPVRAPAERYDATSTPGAVRLTRLDGGIATEMTVCVAPDDDMEVRRLELENRTTRAHRIEVTTYAEVVLLDPAAYAAHPAFAKLFVQTEADPAQGLLLARRRPRAAAERHPWLVHGCHLLTPSSDGEGLQYETDRVRFVGRGHTLAAPRALRTAAPLSGTVGNVLDPIVSLRRVTTLEPGGRATFTILLGAAATRADAIAAARRCRDADPAALLAGAAARERATLASLGLSEPAGEYLQALAGALLYGDPRLRAPADVMRRAHGSLDALGVHGLRRDVPLVVVHAARPEDAALVGRMAAAHRYWEACGLSTDVLVLCDTPALQAEIARAACPAPPRLLVRARETLTRDAQDVIEAWAHLVVLERLPDLGGGRGPAAAPATATLVPRTGEPAPLPRAPEAPPYAPGAFSTDGREYVLTVTGGSAGPLDPPPMPWVNVIANERFGFLVSESGAACTWSRNSRENRVTPWLNDAVRDPHGEALYLRDRDTGEVWAPLPGPVRTNGAAFEVRHGLGYSVWHSRWSELEHEVSTFVPQTPPDPVKITYLRVTNRGARPRHLALFAYHRLVLGVLPPISGRVVVTERDEETGALFARNRLNDEFADGVVFAAAVHAGRGSVALSADRTAFLGRNGSPAAPAGVLQGALDGATGAALDPCAALEVGLEVPPGATVECAVLLGEAVGASEARELVGRYRAPDAVRRALAAARAFWSELAAGVQITTPLPALDRMVNGWLPYQIVSCRIWGRSAFYQSGGAFGFRDQLQDAAAFTLTRPSLTRAQILLHAAHQFVEGDVLHWWHPPTAKGIRTRFADDLLWLPFLTAHYVRGTGDAGILDEEAGFVTGRALAPGEDEIFLVPGVAAERADVYAHCCRALDRSLTAGAHGLPLMGTGDWNDGMNRVGREGRGESVWMAFFLFRVIDDFVPLCIRRGDGEREARYRAYQTTLRDALEAAAWDGEWYRRAYYDDGTPLGSAANAECRIDALAQAWAVLSNAVPRARAARAMDAVERLLVDEPHALIRLLAPPFDRDDHDPGYIKGYLPGIRENGGQYTHAAVWVVEALAELGRRDRAAVLLAMLSPVTHGATPSGNAVYQVEPYVVAADVYGAAPHVGRGGWTWYTGSAGWMYRVAVESILGVRVEDGATLVVAPRVPDTWPGYGVRLQLPDGRGDYDVAVANPTGNAARVVAVSCDGATVPVRDGVGRIPLAAGPHRVEIVLGPPTPTV